MRQRPCKLVFTAMLLLGAASTVQGQAGRMVEWVRDAPASDDSKIALGYEVPLPVDTPLPFHGFRSYAGLHARHQDLAVTTPWVHPEAIGSTRHGRTIWLYRLGDPDRQTTRGFDEQAMLTNGGIHAREWQSPEVATGIIELLALGADDDPLIAYLRDNANILVIPVLNVDGFLQTQRHPGRNWLGTDPGYPETSPRDGRMRRKNMLSTDEDLLSFGDHLLGVDLNRNAGPFWNTNPNRSSDNPESLVHHGSAAHSEPEIRALDRAAELGPATRLSMFTDMHSYSQVHFWVRTGNVRLANATQRLLSLFSQYHRNLPAGKDYVYQMPDNGALNSGIGTTEEYFAYQYQVPSWTLEIEPSSGASIHAPLPGAGADYGGLGRNSHDGFILPNSQIERVRTDLARTFAIAYYRQSGPPSITALHLVDSITGAVVFQAEWDGLDATHRRLHIFQAQPVQLGREYRAWIAWDKPMRWREDGEVTALPGQPASMLEIEHSATANEQALETALGPYTWLAQAGGSPSGYQQYRDDALTFSVSFPANESNRALLAQSGRARLHTRASDLTGFGQDADPGTVAHWQGGAWAGYEDSDGGDQSDIGGADSTLEFEITIASLDEPFVVEAGSSSAWYDPERDGEGFVLEILADARAVMYWFTYDEAGEQDWYMAEGEIRGNRVLFPEMLQVSGGAFGPGFDPDQVVRTPVGSAEFVWSSCDAGEMRWQIDGDDGNRRHGRMPLARLTRVAALDCGRPSAASDSAEAGFSGSWYDPAHSGEGYVLEILADQRALVYWFTFDPEGQRRWFFGVGSGSEGRLAFSEMYTTRGGVFGPGFEPEQVQLEPWGSLELELDCDQGTARFESTESGFPAGTLSLVRLTRLAGLDCAGPSAK